MTVKTADTTSPVDDNKVDANSGDTTDRNDTSSTSQDGSTDKAEAKSGIDIVREVLKVDADNQPIEEESSPSPSDKKDVGAKPDGEKPDAKVEGATPEKKAPADKPDVLVEAEKSNFRNDPVFKKVTGELKELRTTRDDLTKQLETSRTNFEAEKKLADGARGLHEFTRKAGITQDALQELLEIGALAVADPRKAYERLSAIRDELGGIIGEGKLPADLQKKVDDGDLDEADAKRIAKAEAEKRIADGKRAQVTKDAEKTAANDDATKRQKLIESTVNARVTSIATRDPDFKKKETLLHKEVVFLINQRGRSSLKTTDDCLKLVDDAYENVNGFFKEHVPEPRKERKPANGSGGEATNKLADLPKNASGLDITKAALGM